MADKRFIPEKQKENVLNEIFERLKLGESLTQITKDKHLICEKTFYNWVNEDKQILQNYVRAKELQAEYYASDIIRIADDCEPTREAIAKANLQIESRKWTASKLLPKKFGNLNQSTNVQVNIQPVTGMKIIDIIPENDENNDI